MRLFIAINFPDEVKSEIEKTRGEIVTKFPQVAWTKKENIHLTIKFLGNIKEEFQIQSTKSQINSRPKADQPLAEKSKILNHKDNMEENIKKGIEKAVIGVKPFELELERLGFFSREQLIIWLGAMTNPQLSLLIAQLDDQMDKLGFSKERREFTPHITIGRGRHLNKLVIQKIKKLIIDRQSEPFKPFLVSHIFLMKSVLTPSGSIYSALAKFALS